MSSYSYINHLLTRLIAVSCSYVECSFSVNFFFVVDIEIKSEATIEPVVLAVRD
jgi:hypothetical protein